MIDLADKAARLCSDGRLLHGTNGGALFLKEGDIMMVSGLTLEFGYKE